MASGRAFSGACEAADSHRFRLLKYQLYEPIVHDMLKLWRTQTVNTIQLFSAMAQRARGLALHLSATSQRTQTGAGEHHAASPSA